MKSAKPAGIDLFGYGAIGFGVFYLIRIMIIIIRNLFLFDKYGYGIDYIIIFLQFPPAILGTLSIFAGIGILKRKQWGYDSMSALSFFLIFFSLIEFFTCGLLGDVLVLSFEMIFGLSIFCFFNTRKVKELFCLTREYLAKKSVSHIFQIILLLFFSTIYFSSNSFRRMTPYRAVFIPNPQKIYYNAPEKPVNNTTRFLFNYKISIPSDLTIKNFRNYRMAGNSIFLRKPGVFITITDKPNFEMVDPVRKVLNIPNGFEFSKKLLKERIGILPTMAKRLAVQFTGEFFEFEAGEWHGLVQKNTHGYDYSIWHKNSRECFGLTIPEKKMSPDEIAYILTSIKSVPVKKSGEYFKEGQIHLKNGRYEDAKSSFINAICREPKNPDYYYHLADTFFKAGELIEAENFSKQALSLNENHEQALNLLNECRKING